jgi:ABC-type phosphate/phosphonate transport system substrate-binding protein
VASNVSPDVREAISGSFLQMHEDPEGQPILAQGQVARFVRVEDQDYNFIREMVQKAEQVTW